MREKRIPVETVRRLSLYLRTLRLFERRGARVISSAELTRHLDITGAQARRDLAYFGSFGQPGVGYYVGHLREKIEAILGLHRNWEAVLVGAGKLGTALLEYPGFRRYNFRLVAAFDRDRGKVGRLIGGVPVRPAGELSSFLRRQPVKIAVIAVPGRAAQAVADCLVAGGVSAILNFAPRYLDFPAHVQIKSLDMAMEIEGLIYHLARSGPAAEEPPVDRDGGVVI